MKFNFVLLFVVILLAGQARGGEIEFKVDGIEIIPGAFVADMGVFLDTRVTFVITNRSDQTVVVFGSEADGLFDPGRYVLRFNAKQDSWNYPNPANAPTPWASVSDRFKKEKKLTAGESISFVRSFSSLSDCGKQFKTTAYIRLGKMTKPKEIRSENFVLAECDTPRTGVGTR